MYIQDSLSSKVKKYASIILPFLGVGFVVLMLGVIWFWETSGRELYFYQEVIVLNEDIRRGTLISDDLLTTEKIEANKLINDAIINKDEIIGLEARQFIPQKAQLHLYYFEKPSLLTENNKFIVRIPNEWLYSIPNSLRRKDEVIFYEIEQIDINIVSENKKEINTFAENKEIKQKLGAPILRTIVAFVKDSANREVVTVSNEERLNGSSVISEVLVVLEPSELQQLEDAIKSGSKFIIMHTEGVRTTDESLFVK